ncbi:MAG: SidJ-related pseudokinase [Deltaproteobacteria bacterium]|nr:SidJ-related pseudokinase [Deltaproteobacteria bacterium]MBW2074907.1 SidJ-related pseudokinase [Deltaproteobacteria bacterium]
MGWDIAREKKTLENALKTKGLDFTATYLAVRDLHAIVRTYPETIKPETITILKGVLEGREHASQTQAYFLYREAADALASVVVRASGEPVECAIAALKHVLGTVAGDSHRATAEALGSLPFSIHGPKISEMTIQDIPSVNWQGISGKNGTTNGHAPAVLGRSLIASLDKEERLLVVKLACNEDSFQSILREAVWMEHLNSGGYSFPIRFHIPTPIKIKGGYVFRLQNIPVRMPEGIGLHPKRYAIGFIAHKGYFTYPNDHRMERRLTMEEFREVILRNAWLLGRLTSLGIVHCAPIPLFHNRIQRHRRPDNGIYEWQRGGRLDRWLGSCAYPNFGLTGIRDFEHLIAFNGLSRKLYPHIGTHILSLLLVTGSYFRHKDPEKVGLDGQGAPVDARELFDKSALKALIQGIFLSYYHGFVESEFTGEVPFNFDELASRMIEEMGVDRHMEEVLRVVDQEQMTDEAFRDFLQKSGYPEEEIANFKKGAKDIMIHTGPHLGGFNQRISLPELIEFVGSVSALCILDRYQKERLASPLGT